MTNEQLALANCETLALFFLLSIQKGAQIEMGSIQVLSLFKEHTTSQQHNQPNADVKLGNSVASSDSFIPPSGFIRNGSLFLKSEFLNLDDDKMPSFFYRI